MQCSAVIVVAVVVVAVVEVDVAVVVEGRGMVARHSTISDDKVLPTAS